MALARIRQFTREQGFGIIDDPEHGELSFDFEACDFEPEAGDEVEVLEVGKRWDGKLKAKRVRCPAKPRKG